MTPKDLQENDLPLYVLPDGHTVLTEECLSQFNSALICNAVNRKKILQAAATLIRTIPDLHAKITAQSTPRPAPCPNGHPGECREYLPETIVAGNVVDADEFCRWCASDAAKDNRIAELKEAIVAIHTRANTAEAKVVRKDEAIRLGLEFIADRLPTDDEVMAVSCEMDKALTPPPVPQVVVPRQVWEALINVVKKVEFVPVEDPKYRGEHYDTCLWCGASDGECIGDEPIKHRDKCPRQAALAAAKETR